MKDIFKDYSLEQFNSDINGLIKDEAVNNIKLFAATDEAKISVVLKPIDDKNFYYGLHPCFSSEKMIDLLFKSKITTGYDFWRVIFKEQIENNWFKISKFKHFDNSFNIEQSELETILLGKSILQMASHFGFRFQCKDTVAEELKGLLARFWREETTDSKYNTNKHYFSKEKTFFCQSGKNQKGTYIDFLGFWPKVIIDKLDKEIHIRIDNNVEPGELSIEKIIESKLKSKKYITLNELYGMSNKSTNLFSEDKFKLRDGNIYYSGTMPRVTEIKYVTDHPSSEQIKYLIMHVERTTFATVDCMDNPMIMLHPLFGEWYKGRPLYDFLLDFDRYEDKMQSEYLYKQKEDDNVNQTVSEEKENENKYQTVYEKKEIENINDYLERSFNTHTVAVSANLETADHYLLVGKRGKGTIDDGEYYCSVNGQSEFNDENVSFYQDSVYEDLPTLDFNSKKRLDLNNEIQRETIAELGISMFEQDWQYYGVSYLSINNKKNDVKSDGESYENASKVSKRRMHFNVLTYNKSYSNFEEVYTNHENVTEKFENSLIEGIRLNLYKDWKEFTKSSIEKISSFAYDHSGIVSFSILSITMVINIINKKSSSDITSMGITDFFEVIVVFLYIVVVTAKWVSNKDVRQHRRTVRFNSRKFKDDASNKNNSLSKLFNKFNFSKHLINKKEEDFQMHVILKVMMGLYFLQKKEK
ncbi:hypothetical protein [Carnobacterium inhibens]|uniref:Uncharacterized protein n=1 Tax=Carnobacterium inhibens subsp. gilichinskyi TaxID=1266845 RepID=U5SC00_9LACT|nr:hypothetical protein [Carnobacterium inhibens]AGY82824.1 hypothetical protein Q783_06880 [Carnobacterium inhibens subsp. gilichinskyi]